MSEKKVKKLTEPQVELLRAMREGKLPYLTSWGSCCWKLDGKNVDAQTTALIAAGLAETYKDAAETEWRADRKIRLTPTGEAYELPERTTSTWYGASSTERDIRNIQTRVVIRFTDKTITDAKGNQSPIRPDNNWQARWFPTRAKAMEFVAANVERIAKENVTNTEGRIARLTRELAELEESLPRYRAELETSATLAARIREEARKEREEAS